MSSIKINRAFLILSFVIFLNYSNCESDDMIVFESWETYKIHFNKHYYQPAQETKRREAFEENIRTIKEHNEQCQKTNCTFKIAPNDLADLPNQLYLKMHVRLTPSPHRRLPNDEKIVGAMVSDANEIPNELDWRKEGFITPACNQKSCGSCYAFSVAHSISGQIFKRTGQLVMLSEQQIVDCSVAMGNHGCTGGSLRNTLKYVENSGGLMRQVDYPYTATQNRCKFIPVLSIVNISNWAILPAHDEEILKIAVATIGPVAVSINASPTTFQLYSEGIYDDPQCKSNVVNHAMVVIGYTDDYWILKNWWGTKWGENGYMKLKKNVNMCGVSNFAAYVVV